MGIARHENILVTVALPQQLVEEYLHGISYILKAVTGEKLEVDKHLVVARASGMYFLTHIPEPACQH